MKTISILFTLLAIQGSAVTYVDCDPEIDPNCDFPDLFDAEEDLLADDVAFYEDLESSGDEIGDYGMFGVEEGTGFADSMEVFFIDSETPFSLTTQVDTSEL